MQFYTIAKCYSWNRNRNEPNILNVYISKVYPIFKNYYTPIIRLHTSVNYLKSSDTYKINSEIDSGGTIYDIYNAVSGSEAIIFDSGNVDYCKIGIEIQALFIQKREKEKEK